MIRKSGDRFSEKIMLKNKLEKQHLVGVLLILPGLIGQG
jgi:hypothetical protein